MRKFILNILVSLSLMLPALAMPGVMLTAHADCTSGSSAKSQALKGVGATGGDCKDTGVNNLIHTAVNLLSIAVGVIAVVMIISAGLKFITSGGDSQKVANAKGTLIYALVGVAVAAVAQVLVHFVLFQTNNVVGG